MVTGAAPIPQRYLMLDINWFCSDISVSTGCEFGNRLCVLMRICSAVKSGLFCTTCSAPAAPVNFAQKVLYSSYSDTGQIRFPLHYWHIVCCVIYLSRGHSIETLSNRWCQKLNYLIFKCYADYVNLISNYIRAMERNEMHMCF